MSLNDLVKYITQQFVSYVDQPKEDRKRKKKARKEEKSPLSVKWFGLVPMAITMLIKRK
ncbi:YqzE family protein [Pseudalkalibacillus berkeleyi]|uniref:YqzE family protein n=1 Tax=Pseudalkalibacillus berkeleyi TaxID=1069813 RepID=A0ABS9H1C1_9BACL|nr:YqzE family protein [Pseudalkalibacillus berkeleyi]MCF6137881.1 YqzE family protein [Pseudalkalibacillus berkeleyi]